jgi:hypothetical protein
MEAPKHLTHKPIVAVNDYEPKDGDANDARALSIGKAQYNPKDILPVGISVP